jgi:hypothetical protein
MPVGKSINFIAKRKYWIEWHCLFEKHPSEKQLEEAKAQLRRYIQNYLEEYFSKKTKSDIPEPIIEDIKRTFGEEGKATSGTRLDLSEFIVEIFEWKEIKWEIIAPKRYNDAVKENQKLPPEKQIQLTYSVYTKKWMNILETHWKEVSGIQKVFSFRGWFQTRSGLRLTPENRGSMNPPPPPPPPAP